VICLNTGEIFSSIKSAKEKYSASNIGSCCKGIYKYSGIENGVKLRWMYYKDYLKSTTSLGVGA